MAEGEARKMKYSRCAAYRLEVKRVKEPDYPYSGTVLDQPAKVAEFSKSLADSDIEKMLVLYLDTKNRLICLQVFHGTIDRAVIHPREIVKHAILSGAANVVMVHNHPSGIPAASPEDRTITQNIVSACKLVDMRVLDHIIIGTDGQYFSFCEGRMMPS
jgi:DNA repair protein RadC